MSDRIEICGLRVLGVHGLLPEEFDRAQPFEVDLAVSCDLVAAGASDSVEKTVDYGKLVEMVLSVISGPRCDLMETLAERIAQGALREDRVRSVEVAVRKLRPPVPADVVSAGVRIVRER